MTLAEHLNQSAGYAAKRRVSFAIEGAHGRGFALLVGTLGEDGKPIMVHAASCTTLPEIADVMLTITQDSMGESPYRMEQPKPVFQLQPRPAQPMPTPPPIPPNPQAAPYEGLSPAAVDDPIPSGVMPDMPSQFSALERRIQEAAKRNGAHAVAALAAAVIALPSIWPFGA